MGEDSTASRDAIGISLQLLSTFLAALAYVMQKQAHVEIEACGGLAVQPWTHPASKKALIRWRAGFVIMVVCAILDLLSYPLLDLSKQAPMGAVTLMWNTVLASIMLKERFTILDSFCTVLIVVGTIMAVANSEAESADHTFPEIIELLKDDLVYVYSALAIPAILIGIYFVEKTTRRSPNTWSKFQKRCMSILSPALGGMCMGYTGYGAKALSTIASSADWEQFKNPLVYLYAVLAAVAVTGQLRYLNKGLEFFDALHVVPVFQVFIIFSNAMAGIVYYHDMRHSPAYKVFLFALGGVLCSLGIALMLLKTNRPKGKGSAIAVRRSTSNKVKVESEQKAGAGIQLTETSYANGQQHSTARSRSTSSKSPEHSARHPAQHHALHVDVHPEESDDAGTDHHHEVEAPSTPLVTGSTGPAIIRAISRSRTASLFGIVPTLPSNEHFHLDSVDEGTTAAATPAVESATVQQDSATLESVRRRVSFEGEEPPMPWYEQQVSDVLGRWWSRWLPNVRLPVLFRSSQYNQFDT